MSIFKIYSKQPSYYLITAKILENQFESKSTINSKLTNGLKVFFQVYFLKNIIILVRELTLEGQKIFFPFYEFELNVSLVSNKEEINFYVDFDDGIQQNLSMCDNNLILNHVYIITGSFFISVISINDDIFGHFNLTSKFFFNFL